MLMAPIHQAYVERRLGVNASWAVIVKSGYQSGNAGGSDISIDHGFDSLVGQPGRAAKAAEERCCSQARPVGD